MVNTNETNVHDLGTGAGGGILLKPFLTDIFNKGLLVNHTNGMYVLDQGLSGLGFYTTQQFTSIDQAVNHIVSWYTKNAGQKAA